VIEPEPPAVLAPAPPAPAAFAASAADEHHDGDTPQPVPTNEPVTLTAPPPRLQSVQPSKPEPVIPLIHVPDDPGPEVVVDEIEAPDGTKTSGWRNLFG
jgi:hypothetical protein